MPPIAVGPDLTSGADRLELENVDADELEHSMPADAAETSRSETSFDARSMEWIDIAPTILQRDECLSCTIRAAAELRSNRNTNVYVICN